VEIPDSAIYTAGGTFVLGALSVAKVVARWFNDRETKRDAENEAKDVMLLAQAKEHATKIEELQNVTLRQAHQNHQECREQNEKMIAALERIRIALERGNGKVLTP
jgi:hypothetical protein